MIKINYCSDTVAPSQKLLVAIQFANLEYDDTIETQANSTPSPITITTHFSNEMEFRQYLMCGFIVLVRYQFKHNQKE